MESRICPECLFQTDFNIENDGLTSICLNCGTRSVNIKVLKEGVSELKWNELLSKLSHPIISKKSPCKKSGCEIKGQLISTLNNQVEIDVCHQCGQIWFDQFELEECLSILEINFDQKIDPQSLEELKKIKVIDGKAKPRHTDIDISKNDFGFEFGWEPFRRMRKHGWLALLGVPIEIENPVKKTPYLTYLLSFLISITSIYGFYNWDLISGYLAFKPNDPFDHFGMGIFGSIFIHGSYGHLLGNLYMLIMFGDNVEDVIGPKNFLLLFMLGTFLGVFFHSVTTVRPEVILVGASTGISALTVFYGLTFPKSKFTMLFLIFFWIRIPVIVYVVFWLALQVIGVYMLKSGPVAVSFGGHVGGALAGIIYFILMRNNKIK